MLGICIERLNYQKVQRAAESPESFFSCDVAQMGCTMQKLVWAYADSEGPDGLVQSNQGLRCLLTESLDTIECINEEQMSG